MEAGQGDGWLIALVGDATDADRVRLTARGVFIDGRAQLLVSADDGYVAWMPQPFEAEHLGLRSVRVTAFGGSADGAGLLRRAFAALAQRGHDFATIRVPAADQAAVDALRRSGALEIERLITFARPLPDSVGPLPDGTGVATDADADGCAEVGRQAFRFDRFHQDSRIDAAGADSLKAAWMRNACQGRADCVLVARDNGAVVGANACLRHGSDAIIDLIGVLPTAQGRGWGRRLVQAAIAHYAGRATRLLVGTQDSNTASVGLYRATGFSPLDEKITFHAHLRDLP